MSEDDFKEALRLLKFYVDDDDTRSGGDWETWNAPWLKRLRDARELLAKYGMSDDVEQEKP